MMIRKLDKVIGILALIGGIVLFGPTGQASAQGVPPQADPGRVLQHNMRQMWTRQNMPWMYGPLTEEDLRGKPEPVIEFHNMDVEGTIVPKDRAVPSVEWEQ